MARTDVMTTARRIRRQLSSGHRFDQLVLLNTIDDSTTSVTIDGTLPAGLIAGAMLCVDVELMRVRSVNATTNSVNVLRGYLDSTAAEHLSGALIDLNARFSLLDIFEAMRAELASWPPDLYQAADDTFTVDTGIATYELPSIWATALGVIDVRQSDERTSEETTWPRLPHRVYRGSSSGFDGATTSGLLLRFLEPVRSGALHITVALPITSDIAVGDDLATAHGLNDGLLDVLELGVKRRLIHDGEHARSSRDAQDEIRRSEETPIGAMTSIHQMQNAIYTRRRAEEANRLRRFYPIRQS